MELLLENAHIQIFPTTAFDTDSDPKGSVDVDFADTLRKFAKSLPEEYGVVSRINIDNVRITLHRAGKEESSIRITAKKMLKEFGDDSHPNLYNVYFYEGESKVGLNVSHVLWNTEEGNFIVKPLGFAR